MSENIGEIVSLINLYNSGPINENLKLKIQKLCLEYCVFRNTKPDGDSFYRSIMYLYLERLILKGKSTINSFILLYFYRKIKKIEFQKKFLNFIYKI